MTGRQVARNEIANAVGPCWSEAKVVAALGLSANTVASWRDAGAILALPTSDGVLVYPTAQFQRRGGSVEVREALLPFLRVLRGFDPWAVAVLLHTPAPELGDMPPVEWLSNDGAPEVLTRLAETVAREWAAGGTPD